MLRKQIGVFMELLDIVDSNDVLTGEVLDRQIVHSTGLWHREVGVVIINDNNEMLLEKRAPTKKQSPNMWALCAGHIDAGETPDETIVREIKEEIGLDLSIKDLEFLKVLKTPMKFESGQYNNAILYTNFNKTNKKISDYKIQKEELTEVKYFKIAEIERAIAIKDEKFAFAKQDYMKDILTILKTRGLK